jgi:hypothetical protein
VLKQREDLATSLRQADVSAAQGDVAKQLHDVMPTKPVNTVFPRKQPEGGFAFTKQKPDMPAYAAARFAVTHGLSDQASFLSRLQEHLGQLQHSAQDLHGLDLKTNLQHQSLIRDFLAHPDVQKIESTIHDYTARQGSIDPAKVDLGLASSSMRPYLDYAYGEMKGVSHAATPIPTGAAAAAKVDLKAALQEGKGLESDLAKARELRAKETAPGFAASDVSKPLRTAERSVGDSRASLRAHNAEVSDVSARSGVTYGGLKSDQLAETHASNIGEVRRYEDVVKERRVALRSQHKDAVASAEAALKDNRQQVAALKKAASETVQGHVIDTGAGPRQLSAHEIMQHMEAHGVDPNTVAYVSAASPRGNLSGGFGRRPFSRGSSSTPHFKGGSVTKGTSVAGGSALARSQLNDVRMIATAKSVDQHLVDSAVHDGTGTPIPFDKHSWKPFADAYHEQHGIELDPVRRWGGSPTAEQKAAI